MKNQATARTAALLAVLPLRTVLALALAAGAAAQTTTSSIRGVGAGRQRARRRGHRRGRSTPRAASPDSATGGRRKLLARRASRRASTP